MKPIVSKVAYSAKSVKRVLEFQNELRTKRPSGFFTETILQTSVPPFDRIFVNLNMSQVCSPEKNLEQLSRHQETNFSRKLLPFNLF